MRGQPHAPHARLPLRDAVYASDTHDIIAAAADAASRTLPKIPLPPDDAVSAAAERHACRREIFSPPPFYAPCCPDFSPLMITPAIILLLIFDVSAIFLTPLFLRHFAIASALPLSLLRAATPLMPPLRRFTPMRPDFRRRHLPRHRRFAAFRHTVSLITIYAEPRAMRGWQHDMFAKLRLAPAQSAARSARSVRCLARARVLPQRRGGTPAMPDARHAARAAERQRAARAARVMRMPQCWRCCR
jgi:hypothetical protein